jgi:hypothetical protein
MISNINKQDGFTLMKTKADSKDFQGRFREIISDPLNLLINRHHLAGFVINESVILHNGLKVPISGPHAYYGDFSSILVLNRGVHEPLEEFVFQEVIKILPSTPLMLELGAYWGHYSMWLKKAFPDAAVHLVEPETKNFLAGQYNFEQNRYDAEFVQSFVGKGEFEVDAYFEKKQINRLTILHSDIQGFELEMLEGCFNSLQKEAIDYLFISTHTQQLHQGVIETLKNFNYRIEVSSDFDTGTTSYDGFIFASSPSVASVFCDFNPMGRVQILESQPRELVSFLSDSLKPEEGY